MLKNKLLALITAPLLLITFTSVASAAENNSLGGKVNTVSPTTSVTTQAAAPSSVYYPDLFIISFNQEPDVKFFQRTNYNRIYRGYLSKYKTAGTYKYYRGYLYRDDLPYPMPASTKPIEM
ncbi:hypothetical protein NST21_14895 [Peribacillus sp. FSL K6-1552]|uniref:hypothetical protein n=1 Tax=Peribacillus sp. FSL K6-1552 TaxID=2954514 RepID=UPI0030F9E2CA